MGLTPHRWQTADRGWAPLFETPAPSPFLLPHRVRLSASPETPFGLPKPAWLLPVPGPSGTLGRGWGGRGGRGLELPSHLGPVGLTPQLRSLLEQTGCGQSSWQEASHPGGPATPLQRPPRGSGPSGLGRESGNHPQPLWLPWRLCDLCDLQRGRKEASRALPEPAAEVCLTKTVFKISRGINGQLQHWKDLA